jgi:hypothetical protein
MDNGDSSIITAMRRKTNRIARLFIGLAALFVIAIALYNVPYVHSKLAWRLDNLRLSIAYFLEPPQNVAFHPSQQALPSPTLPQVTVAPTITPIPSELATSTITPTPLPSTVILANVPYVDQMNRYNYCGPANLAMALEYWGWKGNPGSMLEPRDQIGAYIKPGVNDPNLNFIDKGNTDVNVMPYEMIDFVNNTTTFKAIYRYGGDADLLKRLISAGFPVITEKGVYEPLLPDYSVQWGGHYSFTTGYDDGSQQFTWQDSYLPKPNSVGKNSKAAYTDYISNWRSFNYVFIIVYPADRQSDLDLVLGPYSDPYWAAQHALDIANQEIASGSLTGNDLFFAMFNKVTSLVNLQNPDYGPAAAAYDLANNYYNTDLITSDKQPVPWRIMWYQTAPYMAYYYSGRYQDLIDLATLNLDKIEKGGRQLEESFFWRARAEYALGAFDTAYADMRQALYYHPNFQPALDMFSLWGVTP